jgi:hypothetical protein
LMFRAHKCLDSHTLTKLNACVNDKEGGKRDRGGVEHGAKKVK